MQHRRLPGKSSSVYSQRSRRYGIWAAGAAKMRCVSRICARTADKLKVRTLTTCTCIPPCDAHLQVIHLGKSVNRFDM
ncbi:hypothetical protein RvY_11943 [Ramazzottius varieornatus]|uniref:Uncharacterized protein n=1 Tax=Ramazzottius varieornatus TaxID=947166 RepID=A0A1D1VHT5_RAMVA|nr:hypothetical protein RvY_11943 [Ramazzottius varieornatus]